MSIEGSNLVAFCKNLTALVQSFFRNASRAISTQRCASARLASILCFSKKKAGNDDWEYVSHFHAYPEDLSPGTKQATLPGRTITTAVKIWMQQCRWARFCYAYPSPCPLELYNRNMGNSKAGHKLPKCTTWSSKTPAFHSLQQAFTRCAGS